MNGSENVLVYLEETARRFGEKTALRMYDDRMSFAELVRRSRTAGAAIAARRSVAGPIAVLAERSILTPVMFFAALYSGSCYVPLDPAMPEDKLQTILKDLEPALILASSREAVKSEALRGSPLLLTLDGIADDGSDVAVTLSRGGDAPLFIVYTSGTTGVPKGIVKSHRAEISFVEAYCRTFGFSEGEVIGNQTPFFFDASSKDLYLMIRTGATMDIIPQELFMAPLELVAYLNEHRITFISWVPTALVIVSRLNTFAVAKPTTLRKVFFVGEVMPPPHLEKWRAALPDVLFVNLYGFSEIAGIACYQEIRDDDLHDSGVLPIGRPLANCRAYLVADGKTVTASGVTGELYIESEALATEYFHAPELTRRNFVDYPGADGRPVRCYRTGDLARYDEAGRLLFVSRDDFQIKHMGVRIELGEIECAAERIADVQRACCVYRPKRSLLHLFCEVTPGSRITKRDILEALNRKLSAYMIPGRIDILPALPLNANGKIDRRLLGSDSWKELLEGGANQ